MICCKRICVSCQLTSKTSSPLFELFPRVAAILLVEAVGTSGDYVISSTDSDYVPIKLLHTHTHTHVGFS